MSSRADHDLSLMLEARKPLAVFQDLVFAHDVDDEIWSEFARHVDQGRLVGREVRDLWPDAHTIDGKVAVGTRLRLYALPDEKWRIDAYLLFAKATKGRPWSDSLEMFVGLLQGSTEEEIAVSIEHFHKSHGSWGAVPAYLKVSNADLDRLQRLGFKALPGDLDSEVVLILSSSLPANELLKAVYQPEASALIRFGIDTKFALKLPFREVHEARVVRFPHDSLADLNFNLKGTIDIIQHGAGSDNGRS